MLPFEGGKLNEVVRGPLDGPLGNVSMQLSPPLVKQDFYLQYGQPTFWPYCESLERCVVYRCALLHCSMPHAALGIVARIMSASTVTLLELGIAQLEVRVT